MNIPQEIKLPMACAEAALEKNAQDVKILDLVPLSSGLTDYFVICSATSDRQVQSICDSIQKRMKTEGVKTLCTEGYQEGRWVLIDFGSVIVHVFLDALREYYDLEGLWKEAVQIPIPGELLGPGATRVVS